MRCYLFLSFFPLLEYEGISLIKKRNHQNNHTESEVNMCKEFQDIINKKREFSKYIGSINVEEMAKKYTRKELSEFVDELRKIDLISLEYKVSEQIQKKKEEEYPEILSVHCYPVIKEMDFLSEKEKLMLDKLLMMIGKGNYVYGLQRKLGSIEKIKMVEDFLIEREVVEAKYYCKCPGCGSGDISSELTLNEKEELEKVFKEPEHECREEMIETKLEYICLDCESDVGDFDNLKELTFRRVCKLVVDRDRSLDNV